MVSFAKLFDDDSTTCWMSTFDCLTEDESLRIRLPNHGHQYAAWMQLLEGFLDKLPRENIEFIPVAQACGKYQVATKESQWKKAQLKTLPYYMRIASDLPRIYRFSEEVEVFLSCCDDHPVPKDDIDIFRDFCKNPNIFIHTPIYAEMSAYVASFLSDLQQRLRDPTTRKRILERRRTVAETTKRTENYVKRLFETCARQVVLRIDFGYGTGHADNMDTVVKDLSHFYENMRRNHLFRHLIGYIAKIEYGIQKGFHVHLLLFFDGSKRNNKSDSHLAKLIGDYWNNVITKGRGRYWNCNDRKYEFDKNKRLGIGVVHADQYEKMENLLYVVRYLCKKDQFIKPRTNPKIKLLRTGKWPNLTQPKRGAPRASLRKDQNEKILT